MRIESRSCARNGRCSGRKSIFNQVNVLGQGHREPRRKAFTLTGVSEMWGAPPSRGTRLFLEDYLRSYENVSKI